jgi:hypothetical protein
MNKVLVFKDINSTGDSVIRCETEAEVREKVKDSDSVILVLPDGRTCRNIDELLATIQEEVYNPLPEIQVYRLPILVGG